MNKETFAKYINNPSLLDNDTLPEIKTLIDEFPYFQSAWVLYIKNLHSIKDIRYENKLRTACAFISDRKLLHDILKDKQPQSAVNQTEVQAAEIIAEHNELTDSNATTESITVQTESQAAEIPSESIEPIGNDTLEQNTENQIEEKTEGNANIQPQSPEAQLEETIYQPEELLEESTIVQTQNFASQSEIQDNEIPESSNHQIFESANPEPEEPESSNHQIFESSNPEPEEPESSNHQIFESSNPEPEEPESSNHQIFESANPEPEEPEPSNIQIFESSNPKPEEPESSNHQIFESSNPEPEEPESSNHQIFESSNPEPEEPESSNHQIIESSNPEPDKPESLADRILRQAEERRRAKAAAAAAIVQEQTPEIIQSQSPEAQLEETIYQPEELLDDSTIVQTQNFESQSEIQDNEIPESSNNQTFESSNPKPEEPESSNHQIFESSNPEPEEPEPSNIQIFESSNPKPEEQETINAIDQSQIRELIEKQLRSLGINANITFTGNIANIQFATPATNDKPKEKLPEQPITGNEHLATTTVEGQSEKRKIERKKKANLIDKFLETEAKIVPIKDYHSDSKLTTESLIEDEELFTEQLAKIYIKQGHLEKALETYEKLYLKYPEKSIYFATRIEYVKSLMNK